ncbi:hypothetical protein HOLleu_42694 [Holothuria leucospilota]|uniref:Uncharacterized protein n=1 Tax=Holothuria leucospilota TaxID=206669 RepID=A0A9Q0YBE0_HOLLE|nr:hypothetical protein HOLleu_42694 [Holothuria leucospilota]
MILYCTGNSQEACRRFHFQHSLQSDPNSDLESDEEYTIHRPAKRCRSHVSKVSNLELCPVEPSDSCSSPPVMIITSTFHDVSKL